jgi:glycosyltransferase involved in cell wall biosynthesis
MIFFIFSYNRGEFLANCVRSVEECSPGSRIVIFDDQSEDPYTREVLEQVSARHVVASAGDDQGHKHGGLYSNMQAALESLEKDEVICFLQDDTQLVRPLSEVDHGFISQCFIKVPSLGFLSPVFFRGVSAWGRGLGEVDYDADMKLFFRRASKRSAGIYYSDIFISTSERLRSNGWRFEVGEPENEVQAKAKFSAMGYLKCPFAMWLPNGPAYRGKKKTLALRVAERSRSCGFYPFRYMTEDEVRYLRSSPVPVLPVAEDFLELRNGHQLTKPWIYNPLQQSRVLKHLNRAELLAKSVLRFG